MYWLFVIFLLNCQKAMLIITNAIPIGRKATLPPIAPTIMKRIPLIEKNIAAVLYDFEFLAVLLFTMKVCLLHLALLGVYSTFLWKSMINIKGGVVLFSLIFRANLQIPLNKHRDVCHIMRTRGRSLLALIFRDYILDKGLILCYS